MGKSARYNKLRKREYIKIVKQVICYHIEKYDLSVPYIRETKLPDGCEMATRNIGDRCVIAFDYQQFQKKYGNLNYRLSADVVANYTAHEMRHCYQHKQLQTQTPCESKRTLKKWYKNMKSYVDPTKQYNSYEDYCMQPIELDAYLHGYKFCVDHCVHLCVSFLKNEKFYNQLEKEYKRLYKKDVKKYFNAEILGWVRACGDEF